MCLCLVLCILQRVFCQPHIRRDNKGILTASTSFHCNLNNIFGGFHLLWRWNRLRVSKRRQPPHPHAVETQKPKNMKEVPKRRQPPHPHAVETQKPKNNEGNYYLLMLAAWRIATTKIPRRRVKYPSERKWGISAVISYRMTVLWRIGINIMWVRIVTYLMVILNCLEKITKKKGQTSLGPADRFPNPRLSTYY